MKFFAAIAFLLSVPASAASFNYRCVLGRGDDTVNVRLNSRTMTLLDQIEGNGSRKKGDLVYKNFGPQGGTGKMKDRLDFTWSKEKSSIYNWNSPSTFYVQPELLRGGSRLKNGNLGGFITFVGGGYSYESYVCYQR